MSKTSQPQSILKGVIPPMVTPLLDPDTLDVAGLEKVIEHVLAGGVHGVFILGTTGEAQSLSYWLRHELIERTCRQVAGRVPVLVGITDTSISESCHLAEVAGRAGAAAAVLAPPYYFPVTQRELLNYVSQIARQTPLPLYLYNMPSRTGVTIEVETAMRAMELPKVLGIKDSSGDLDYARKMLQAMKSRPDRSYFIGPEELLADALQLGAQGGVCGGANLNPRLFVDLFNACAAGDRKRVEKRHAQVLRMGELLYSVSDDEMGYLKGLKCALSLVGLCQNVLAPPLEPLNDAQRKTIRERLETVKRDSEEGEFVAEKKA